MTPRASTLRHLALTFCSALALSAAGAADATSIPLLDPRTAAFVGQAAQGPLDTPVLLTSYTAFVTTFGSATSTLANPYLAPSVAAYFANGGQQLVVVRVAGADDVSLIGVDGAPPGARTGLQALRDVAGVGAVAIPGATSNAVQSAMISLCAQMGDRMAILDSVSPVDPSAVTAQRGALVSANGDAALYFPWVQAAPAGVALTMPPSGFVAAVYAKDSPQVSPTGALATVTGLTYAVSSTLDASLNAAGICSLRAFAGPSFQLWGARTIASNPEYQYIVVRREANAIATSVRAGTAWCTTQPNDAALWAQLQLDLASFLQSLFLAGWFKGTTASQAYFARCDATTMTAQDIADGKTILLAGFAPLRPAEFVLLQVTQQHALATAVRSGATACTFAAPRPNPARTAATLAFTLPRDGVVTLRVFDVRGALVRTLAAGSVMNAGRHEIAWDMRDESGALVRPALYLARLESGRDVATQRVIRLQ